MEREKKTRLCSVFYPVLESLCVRVPSLWNEEVISLAEYGPHRRLGHGEAPRDFEAVGICRGRVLNVAVALFLPKADAGKIDK